MKAALIFAILGVLLLVGAVTAVTTAGTLPAHLAATYQPVEPAIVGGSRPSSRAYRSADGVAATVAAITNAWPPAERLDDPTGAYLRYQRHLVAVLPHPDGSGSVITLDTMEEGYDRYYPYVGRRWGSLRGFGPDFRGGGPGAGK